MSHTKEDLKELQSKTLEEKIQISTARIIEWYEGWGGQVYVSFSGGKDSTVLLDLVRKIYPDVPAVFADTGLEYPEIREFVKKYDNVVWAKPKITFGEVLTKYGYPIISKECSLKVQGARSKPDGYCAQAFDPNSPYNIKYKQIFSMERWKFLLEADFRIGENCCNAIKKAPIKLYEKQTGRHPYYGIMTEDSMCRRAKWLKEGCNAFKDKRPTSSPLSFWTEQDILKYLKEYNLPYCKIYGNIIEDKEKLKFTGVQRTGCMPCMYGCHREKEPNRFQQMAITHPQLYDYCMRGGCYDEQGMWIPDKGLGMAKVLDYINVKWWNDGDEDKRDEYRRIYHEKEETEKQRKLTESEINE